MDVFAKADLKDNTDVFLLGDLNIDMDSKDAASTRELAFTTAALGLKQQIEGPTRYVFKGGVLTKTRIDLIFTNSDIIVLDVNLSDHLAVMVTRKKVYRKQT